MRIVRIAARSAAQQFGEFAASLTWHQLPTPMQQQVMRAVRDNFGVTLAGVRSELGQKLLKTLVRLDANPEAYVVSTPSQTSIRGAAMHGWIAHSCQRDEAQEEAGAAASYYGVIGTSGLSTAVLVA